jgi:uncharacterized RDD family membrane protein YckC
VNEVAKKQVRTIGFGRRLVATLYDGLLVFFMSFILIVIISFILLFYASFNPNEEVPVVRMTFFTGILLSLFYYVGFWSTSGQTIGKATMGIKVVGPNGKPLSFWRALLRWIGFIVSAVVFSIGFIWIEFNEQRRGWHDILSGSRVIWVEDSFDDLSDVEFVPGNQGKGWVWILIWVLVAISPVGLTALSLFVLSPYINDVVMNILGR